MQELITSISPDVRTDGIKIFRFGKYKQGVIRPIKFIMPCPQNALSVLRNKKTLNDNIFIQADQTHAQRQYLKNLRVQLNQLQSEGVLNKTIRFINGVPKIVNKPKNA